MGAVDAALCAEDRRRSVEPMPQPPTPTLGDPKRVPECLTQPLGEEAEFTSGSVRQHLAGMSEQLNPQVLRARIATGEYPPRTMISEVRLEQEFGVARVTVRKVTAALRTEGLIITTPGMGSFVAEKPSAAGDALID